MSELLLVKVDIFLNTVCIFLSLMLFGTF